MTKLQLVVVGLSVVLFLTLYLGCETKAKKFKTLEKTRALSAESTDAQVLINEAKPNLSAADLAEITSLEQNLAAALLDSVKVNTSMRLSGKWFELGQAAISGYYAEQIAELEATAESWSIAGTTYTLCLQRSTIEKVRSFCSGRAVRAFENAISIQPNEIKHQINLALCYTESPPKDNPMKGILMLVELNEQFPNNVKILSTLGRLAIQTGQFGRAIERLEAALQIEPDNRTAVCLIAQAYEASQQMDQAQVFKAKCEAISAEEATVN